MAPQPLKLGDKFEVSVEYEARDANGALLARYLPGLGYRLTARNKPYIDPLFDAGVASRLAPGGRGDRPFEIGSGPSAMTGRVTIGKKKED